MVPRTSKKFLSQAECDAVLKILGEGRRALLDAGHGLSARSPVYREMSHLIDDIDALACLLTGNRGYFAAPGHSTPAPARRE